jgi:Flp pilus assembly protein TadD
MMPRTTLARPLLLLVALTAIAAGVYQMRVRSVDPADYHARKGHLRLEDGRFEEAVAEFDEALRLSTDHVGARLGKATALLQSGNEASALSELDGLVAAHDGFAAAHAQRGILLDRMGRHAEAVAEYRRALELDPDGFDGPGFLWRFLHNVSEKPATIRERADYIEGELAKPPEERRLRLPEADEKQKMYKVG